MNNKNKGLPLLKTPESELKADLSDTADIQVENMEKNKPKKPTVSNSPTTTIQLKP